MEFEKPHIDRSVVRDEIIAQLKLFDVNVYTLPSTPELFHFGYPQGRGHKVGKLLEDVYQSLVKAGKVPNVPNQSSNIPGQWQGEVFNSFLVHGVVFEEVMSLAREGIIVFAHIDQHDNYQLSRSVFAPNLNRILITEYGASVIRGHPSLPYFADEHIKFMAQTAEPDEELKGYLTEGLACLHNNLPRAALILLRLPCEHVLQKLIDSIDAKLPEGKQKSNFRGKIREAGTNLEKRANFVFGQLESDSTLLTVEPRLKARLNNELKPTFHNIRESAGNAAHRNVPVDRSEVKDLYRMFTSQVYKIGMKIVQAL